MSCIFGENRDIFFPKLSEALHLITFADIAVKCLKQRGYDFPTDFEPKYEPMFKEVNYLKLNIDTDPTPFFNRYKTSVRYVDSMATKVLDKLKKSGDLENTLVIITCDHGQEINDNKFNFWGHNSNFTDAQVNVPFATLALALMRRKCIGVLKRSPVTKMLCRR